jgi:hypothetical protein
MKNVICIIKVDAQEVNTEKTKYTCILVSQQHNAGLSQKINTANTFFETKFDS